MSLPAVVYFYCALAAVYVEATIHCFLERKYRFALRELIVVLLYCSIAIWTIQEFGPRGA
jgi:hypothetical protein